MGRVQDEQTDREIAEQAPEVATQRCPNCGRQIDPNHITATRWPDMLHANPNPGHSEGCVLVALLGTLEDRGHDLSDCDLSEIDSADIWGRFGGPACDAVAEELGLEPYPKD